MLLCTFKLDTCSKTNLKILSQFWLKHSDIEVANSHKMIKVEKSNLKKIKTIKYRLILILQK